MKYQIFAQLRGFPVEKLDIAEDKEEAELMIEAYQLKYGAGWLIWAEEIQ